jgi:hypothetical protein
VAFTSERLAVVMDPSLVESVLARWVAALIVPLSTERSGLELDSIEQRDRIDLENSFA